MLKKIWNQLDELSTWGGVGALATGVNAMLTEFGAEKAADNAARAADAAANAGAMIATGMHPAVAIGLTILGALGILTPTKRARGQ